MDLADDIWNPGLYADWLVARGNIRVNEHCLHEDNLVLFKHDDRKYLSNRQYRG